MLPGAAVKKASTRNRTKHEGTMVYYDDDYRTYRVISADTYYRSPAIFESDIVWCSDEGYCWTRHKIQQHPG